ncbi:MAG: amino acid adenylation domain-containing protein [Kastovskya adunca ATA6-11-RM4]|jgi:amino acid adenylation domain-containing protein|nr:amino acid adenylation domain-containing protein [Kastovskya adunca ATA6-11-RM4]
MDEVSRGKKMKTEGSEVFVFPASFAQQRLWFLDQLFPGNTFYNVSAALRLTGVLNAAALEETFNEIVRRHEALRTTFRMLEGEPVQVIAPTLTLPLSVVDLRSASAIEQEAETRRLAIEERSRPFDLSQEPLLRVMLLQLAASEQVILLNLHHIVCDGWSIGVLIQELGALYTAFANNKRSPLAELPIQYADFAHWQRQWLQGEVLEDHLGYWKQQLENLPRLDLPTDRPHPATPTYRGTTQFLELPKSLSQRLEALSQRQGVTLFMTLLAAFQTLLYRYTQQTDIVVGLPIANRNRREIEGLIGFFVNSLVLRTNLSGNPPFLELLGRVREVALEAYAHQDLPFEKLVEELHPERTLSHHPLFQVAFSLQNTPIEALKLPGLTLSQMDVDNPSAKLDLEFHLWESPEGLRGQVVYSSDLFDEATITRMLGHYNTLLQGIVTSPEQCIGELPLLTVREQHQLLVEWNHTRRDYPQEQCFHQLFAAQVEQTPEAIALVFEDKQLTYSQLNIRANQLAHYLQKLGVVPEVLVGICLDRSVEMIVGLLGILKAGGGYLPLDPTYPQERLNFMLEDAQVSILLTDSLNAALFQGWGDLQQGGTIVCLDKDAEMIGSTLREPFLRGITAIAQPNQQNPTSRVTADNLAYVIYTSGSTGKPKGVQIQHRGLCNLAKAQIEIFNLSPGKRVLQFASLSFDASIFEIVMALLTGATLYLAKKASLLPGQSLIELLRDKAITHVTLPPAVLTVLPTAELPALQTIIAAGESCSPDIVRRWAANRQFFNAYGPTEATIWSMVAEIPENSTKPVIGHPIANTQVYILDAQLQPVPIGIRGELYIGGDGLARGYLNRPELTAERFIPNPLRKAEVKGQPDEAENLLQTSWNTPPWELRLDSANRLYKTGDLARYRPDGNIEFLGRMDDQVKIRGFRIELGEIEAVLSQHLAVRETAIVAREDVPGTQRLVAYVVPSQETSLMLGTPGFAPALRQFLKEKLPEYMVPSAFVVLESLPLTPNGKVDRRALPAPDWLQQPREKVFIAPRTPTQLTLAKIWAEVLHLERVGIDDNFFDLGGDSLLAVRLVEQIHQQFQQELPLSTLFLNPTVAALASTLSSETDLPWSPLVPIQPAGSNLPFFCVHPIFGVVFPYYELAAHLGADQPFYGLQPLGIDGKHPPLNRVEDMAAYYIKALRAVQPEGPYSLGGWSFGGLVAFEMAQQLQRQGQQVALLAVLDTLAPVSGNKPSLWAGCKFLITTVGQSIWPFVLDYFYLLTTPNQPQSDAAQGDRFGWRNAFGFPLFRRVFQRMGINRSWQSLWGRAALSSLIPQSQKRQILRERSIRPLFPVFQANSQATLSYVPQIYQGKITLLRATTQVSGTDGDPTLGWSQLTMKEVDVHLVAGNHLTILKKPHVQVLGEQLRRCLEKGTNTRANTSY